VLFITYRSKNGISLSGSLNSTKVIISVLLRLYKNLVFSWFQSYVFKNHPFKVIKIFWITRHNVNASTR